MKIKQALIGFFLLSCLYIGALFFIQANTQIQTYATLLQLWHSLPVLLGVSLIVYCLRFLRWRFLLSKASYSVPFKAGALAYMSGYALTISPGKVGELIRIRYCLSLGMPAHVVISAFVFERTFDLIAVLVLASLYVGRSDILIFLLVFVFIFLAVVLWMALSPQLLERIEVQFKKWNFNRLSHLIHTLKNGFLGAKIWLNKIDCAVALLVGVLAWLVSSLSFVYLLNQLQIQMPFIQALAAYPLAMLAGAASMIPGGVGSVEAVLISLLAVYSVPVVLGSMAVIGFRISAIWTATILGILSLSYLEFQRLKKNL